MTSWMTLATIIINLQSNSRIPQISFQAMIAGVPVSVVVVMPADGKESNGCHRTGDAAVMTNGDLFKHQVILIYTME